MTNIITTTTTIIIAIIIITNITCFPPQPMYGTICPYLYWAINWDTYFSIQIL